MKPLDEIPLDDLIYWFNRGDPEQVDAAAARLRELTDEGLRTLVDRLRVDPNATTVPNGSTVNAVIAVGLRAVPLLIQVVEADGLNWDRGYALMRLGDRRAAGVFVQELETPGAGHRELATEALGELGVIEEIPRLRRLLKDDDPWVAGNAAWSLAKLGDTESVEAIAAIAGKSDVQIGPGAIRDLALLDPAVTPAQLAPVLVESRLSAIHGLALLDHPVARDQLVALLSDKNAEVRVAAIEGISKARYRGAIPALLEMIDGADGIELEELLIALAELPDRSAVPQLRKIVETRPDCAVPYGPVLAELAAAALRAIENSGPP